MLSVHINVYLLFFYKIIKSMVHTEYVEKNAKREGPDGYAFFMPPSTMP